MKALSTIFLFLFFFSVSAFTQSKETVKPPEGAKKEVVTPPQKPGSPDVKPVKIKKPEVTKGAKPQQGAKPEVVRPDRRRPAGAGRPAGARRPPIRRIH